MSGEMRELETPHLVSRSRIVNSLDSFDKQLLTQYGWQDKQTTKWNEEIMRTSLQKNLQPIPRTVSEATRDAQYACAIQTFKSDAKLALNFMSEAIQGALIVLAFGGAIFGLAYMFLKG